MYMSNVVLCDELGAQTRSKAKVRKVRRDRGHTLNRISDEDFIVPLIGQHELLLKNSYNVKQLKAMCRWHKLKVSGTKNELTNRLYEYLQRSMYAMRIQRLWRRRLLVVCNSLRGPAVFNRSLCVNETDFFSMDDVSSISLPQFISYRCLHDNKVYGFDVSSMYKLLAKGGQCNPYTREALPTTIKKDVNRLIRLSAMTGQHIEFQRQEIDAEVSPLKQVELRVIAAFQIIDALGNITNHNWFWELGRVQLIRFIRELADIWGYRAQLSDSVKREICPPDGNPFRGVDLPSLPTRQLTCLRRVGVGLIENLVKRGTNSDARGLGASYVLCALTLVSVEAAQSLPWLYDAVVAH